MSRILLADDSPHAQRIGEYILREEGYEVVSVTDGETAILRVADVDPDVVLADVLMPSRSGYQICQYIKADPRFRHTRVVLTVGAVETFDETEAQRVGSDGVLRRPFEASEMLRVLRPLVAAAYLDRGIGSAPPSRKFPIDPSLDVERVRAAVALALDSAMSDIIDKITEKVLVALSDGRPSDL